MHNPALVACELHTTERGLVSFPCRALFPFLARPTASIYLRANDSPSSTSLFEDLRNSRNLAACAVAHAPCLGRMPRALSVKGRPLTTATSAMANHTSRQSCSKFSWLSRNHTSALHLCCALSNTFQARCTGNHTLTPTTHPDLIIDVLADDLAWLPV